mmetsp:Transcript_20442/g.59199  ORF Transcript_20442/g.59199 Transcript_20442/m.59199 type:complete len:216 (-) Transcript_20442:1699-2346(-)
MAPAAPTATHAARCSLPSTSAFIAIASAALTMGRAAKSKPTSSSRRTRVRFSWDFSPFWCLEYSALCLSVQLKNAHSSLMSSQMFAVDQEPYHSASTRTSSVTAEELEALSLDLASRLPLVSPPLPCSSEISAPFTSGLSCTSPCTPPSSLGFLRYGGGTLVCPLLLRNSTSCSNLASQDFLLTTSASHSNPMSSKSLVLSPLICFRPCFLALRT